MDGRTNKGAEKDRTKRPYKWTHCQLTAILTAHVKPYHAMSFCPSVGAAPNPVVDDITRSVDFHAELNVFWPVYTSTNCWCLIGCLTYPLIYGHFTIFLRFSFYFNENPVGGVRTLWCVRFEHQCDGVSVRGMHCVAGYICEFQLRTCVDQHFISRNNWESMYTWLYSVACNPSVEAW